MKFVSVVFLVFFLKLSLFASEDIDLFDKKINLVLKKVKYLISLNQYSIDKLFKYNKNSDFRFLKIKSDNYLVLDMKKSNGYNYSLNLELDTPLGDKFLFLYIIKDKKSLKSALYDLNNKNILEEEKWSIVNLDSPKVFEFKKGIEVLYKILLNIDIKD